MEWCDIDEQIESQLDSVYKLFLFNSYELGKYKVLYDIWFLRDQLARCKYKIALKNNGIVIAFVSGRIVNTNKGEFLEINYLCIDKCFRGKGIVKNLKSQLKSKVRTKDAIYTTPTVFENKLQTLRYYHRLLNVKSNQDGYRNVGYTFEQSGESLGVLLRMYNEKYYKYDFYEILDETFFAPKFGFNVLVVYKEKELVGFVTYYDTQLVKRDTRHASVQKNALLYYYTVPHCVLISDDFSVYLRNQGVHSLDTLCEIGTHNVDRDRDRDRDRVKGFVRGTGEIQLCSTSNQEFGNIGYLCI